LYRIQVDLSGGGDFVVLADTYEEAVDFIRPHYTVDLEEDDVHVEERDMDEPGVVLSIA